MQDRIMHTGNPACNEFIMHEDVQHCHSGMLTVAHIRAIASGVPQLVGGVIDISGWKLHHHTKLACMFDWDWRREGMRWRPHPIRMPRALIIYNCRSQEQVHWFAHLRASLISACPSYQVWTGNQNLKRTRATMAVWWKYKQYCGLPKRSRIWLWTTV